MTHWRTVVEKVLTVAGITTILAGIVFSTDLVWQIGIALVGILMLEAGVWGIAQELVSEERTYGELRDTVDEFMERVRALNEQAVDGDEAGVAEEREAMHALVDRMAEVAGREEKG